MNKDKQKIISKVYALVPELKRLEFGCEIKIKWCEYGETEILLYDERYMNCNEDNRFIIEDSVFGEIIEIIGKPITIHFLIKALMEKYITTYQIKAVEIIGLWNFSIEDNLELQLENPELNSLLKEILL